LNGQVNQNIKQLLLGKVDDDDASSPKITTRMNAEDKVDEEIVSKEAEIIISSSFKDEGKQS
jgi:hypothetical protein